MWRVLNSHDSYTWFWPCCIRIFYRVQQFPMWPGQAVLLLHLNLFLVKIPKWSVSWWNPLIFSVDYMIFCRYQSFRQVWTTVCHVSLLFSMCLYFYWRIIYNEMHQCMFNLPCTACLLINKPMSHLYLHDQKWHSRTWRFSSHLIVNHSHLNIVVRWWLQMSQTFKWFRLKMNTCGTS